MQAHAQLSGQVTGASQLTGVSQQNLNTLQSQKGWHRTEVDYPIRRMIVEKILLLFEKRKPGASQDSQQKLPEFVKCLEESLYWDASSKEEYADLNTLEHRLQMVAKRVFQPRNNQNFAARGINASSSSMIPTPGMASAITGSTMIPTPGNEISSVPTAGTGLMNSNSSGMGNVLPSNSAALLQGHGMSSGGNIGNMVPTPGLGTHLFTCAEPTTTMPGSLMATSQGRRDSMSLVQNTQMMPNIGIAGVGNQMIPTPGLNSSHVGSNVNSSAGVAFSNVDTEGVAQSQQQQYISGTSGHMYRNMNGQLGGGSMASHMQRKNPSPFGFVNGGISNGLQLMSNGQHLVNRSPGFSNTTMYMNSTQQHINQQRQQQMSMQSTLTNQTAITPADGYTANASDLAAPGSFYTAGSAGLPASSLGMHSQGLLTSKTIPASHLSSQQSSMQLQHQLQQPQSQGLDKFQQMNYQKNTSGLTRNQQQLELSKALYQDQSSLKLYGQKQAGVASKEESQPTSGLVNSLSPLFQASPDQQQSHLQHTQTLTHQQVSHQQTSRQQHQQHMPQQAQRATQQQLWHQQAQCEQQLLLPQQQSSLQQQQEMAGQQQRQRQQQQHLQQPQMPQHQNQQQPNHLQQQQNLEQLVQQNGSLQQMQELQQQKSQQSSISQQVIVQQSPQISSWQPQQQGASIEQAEEPHSSHQVAANGTLSTPQAANGSNPAPLNSETAVSADGQRAQQYLKQQRWLLFLRHASRCTAPEGQCQTAPHCHTGRQLLAHITKCIDRDCQYARCHASRMLVRHHQQCRDVQCPVCAPVKQKLYRQRMQAAQSLAVQGHPASVGMATVASGACGSASTSGMATAEASSNKYQDSSNATHMQQPPAKRAKVEPTEQVDAQQGLSVVAAKAHTNVREAAQVQTFASTSMVKSEALSGKVEGNGPGNATVKSEVHGLSVTNAPAQRVMEVKSEINLHTETGSGVKQAQPTTHVKSEPSSTITHKGSIKVEQDIVSSAPSPGLDPSTTAKSSKSKIKGVSLTELFTPEQINEHIAGLRQWVGQSKAKVEKNQAMEHQMNENSCQLCAVETLTFEPPPIYCTPCGTRIKRNAPYWTMQCGETRHYFCIPCYNDARADTVEVDGINYPKSKLEKRKNDEETEEPWVQCDKCEKWQHQVCALFNMRRNEGGQAEYTCPNCLIEEIEKGERKPLPQSAVLGAKDLPRTLLSDHIEHRLARRLKQERLDRARAQGKGFDEVPGADSLVIRVVSSVDKKLEVKQRFLEIFQEEDYPTEFPYKSKVLLLFQKIEGVEVCLFGMYVQEFGAESAQPNQRRVYLSYLDSVKYFRPDVRTLNGEALRTFVYHEILIGYLDYCKKRGFTSCYIWACPPLKGEDYILYCHPEIQKTPKSDKLREWYLTMLRKATNESVVVEVTNMYDHFFVSTGETKAKVTAARLPYFDGDYWPGAAEDMIMQLQEEEDGRRQQKKGKTKKPATKRATKAASQAELASNASKDLQLMHKLGECIYPMKEDFIMVHLHHTCTRCCNFIVSGNRWVCRLCRGFQICERCHDVEQKLDVQDKHPSNSRDSHPLVPVAIADALGDTKDKDEIMESEFFDTRQAFLSLCQGNHYQYDTLRRAKHSSMMVLYHLHNPTAPAFVTTCNMCHRDIETGQGWRCETCPDFDLCDPCYSKDDSVKHPHKLSPHPSAAEREAQSKEARQHRVLQLRKMLDLLVHASQCGSAQCQYPNCRRVKALFRHGMVCKTRASGGCPLCKKMWYLLQLHARACKESECRVPRCKDLKEHLRRLQQQMESRRRAAVMEMMRQRTAEAAAGTG